MAGLAPQTCGSVVGERSSMEWRALCLEGGGALQRRGVASRRGGGGDCTVPAAYDSTSQTFHKQRRQCYNENIERPSPSLVEEVAS